MKHCNSCRPDGFVNTYLLNLNYLGDLTTSSMLEIHKPRSLSSPFGLLQQNTKNQVTYKQQKFNSYTCGDWHIQDQGAGDLVSGKSLLPAS